MRWIYPVLSALCMMNCYVATDAPCYSYEFECLDRSFCLGQALVCDGVSDCDDSSDEFGCVSGRLDDAIDRLLLRNRSENALNSFRKVKTTS